MSKFLTPPVWYDKNGEENQSLVNAANAGVSGPTNIAFGLDAKSGTDNDSHSCIAIGYEATATGKNTIAIGSYNSDGQPVGPDAGTRATGSGTIVIGGGASAAGGGIAIGDGASATANQIQLGNNNTAYTLSVGNGRMSLNIGSTAQGNWISATSNGISQGLYLVRYGGGSYMDLVYLMAPIEIMDISSGSTYTNDWYFPFYTNPYRLTINDSSHPIVCSCNYLKVDKTSSASNLKITPGYYKNDGDNLTPVFQAMGDGSSVYLLKIL